MAAHPAGWYTDPGQSGGKRWWDGSQWTAHLRAPEAAAPKQTSPQSTPYGINAAATTSGYVPMNHSTAFPASMIDTEPAISNRAGWLSLLSGILALATTATTFLPGSLTFWVTGVGIVALLFGARALSQRSKGLASIVWAPLIGMVFGIAAVAMTIVGLSVPTLVSSATGGAFPAASTTTQAYAIQTSPEPFVFPSNQALTADGSTVQQLATSINRTYASGNSTLGAGQSWPQLQALAGTKFATADGAILVTLPSGENFTYRLSTDQKNYTLTVASGDLTEVAIYYSATDQFSFNCPVAATNCNPGH